MCTPACLTFIRYRSNLDGAVIVTRRGFPSTLGFTIHNCQFPVFKYTAENFPKYSLILNRAKSQMRRYKGGSETQAGATAEVGRRTLQENLGLRACVFVFVGLGFNLRACLSHTSSSFCSGYFGDGGPWNYLPDWP
jgi:hypothetical protein